MKKAKKRLKINDHIEAASVRLVGPKKEQMGIMSLEEAKEKAKDMKLDLVEISPIAVPAVCMVMDYGKYLFEKKKEEQLARKKQKNMQVKEIKLRPATERGDLDIKVRNIVKFLTAGNKVKITIRFRGREFVHKEIGFSQLELIEKSVESCGAIEQSPKMEGRQMIMVLAPKKS